MKHRTLAACITAAILLTIPAAASEADAMEDWQAVNDGRLDQLRGGFITNEGLKLSFSIERAVYINGELMTKTVLALPELSTLGKIGQPIPNQTALSNIVQNGPNNSVSLALPPGVFTVVQNSLDQQAIRGMTTINATLSGVGQIELPILPNAR